MTVETDDDRLALLDDFGVEATIAGKTVIGILDNEWQDGNGIAVTVPVFTVRTSDIEDYARGTTLTIGATSYTIAEPMPDGQGITHIMLQEA